MRHLIAPALEADVAAHSGRMSGIFRDLARITRAKTACPQMQVGHLEGSFLRLLARIGEAARRKVAGRYTHRQHKTRMKALAILLFSERAVD